MVVSVRPMPEGMTGWQWSVQGPTHGTMSGAPTEAEAWDAAERCCRAMGAEPPPRLKPEAHDRLREAARRLISVYMADGDLGDAINELEDAAGLSQQGGS